MTIPRKHLRMVAITEKITELIIPALNFGALKILI